MWNKTLSLFLCICLIFGCTGIAYADETEPVGDSQIIEEVISESAKENLIEEGETEPEEPEQAESKSVIQLDKTDNQDPVSLSPEDGREKKEPAVPHWSGQISQMTQAGSYEEGTVVVCIGPEKYKQIYGENEPAVLDGDGADLLLDQAEEIMQLDPDMIESSSSVDAIPNEDSKDKRLMAAASDEKVTLSVIRNGNMTTGQMLEILARDDRVLFAEPNYTSLIDTGAVADKVLEEAGLIVSAEDTVNSPVAEPGTVIVADDITPEQWGNSEAAQYHAAGKDRDVSIKVPGFGPEGSNMTGDPITLAVLDFAVDFNHPDLAPVAYTFSEEEQARLGCDAHGYNATWQSMDGKLICQALHGTHCAGIIGAAWDGHGISGVASNVRIVSVQITNDDGKTSLVNALRAFAFIKKANEETNADIRITSNSWRLIQYSRALDAAVRDLGESQGVISFFSAANDAADLPQTTNITNTLIDNPYVIIVASTDPAGDLSWFSNYSDQIVDLCAPGTGILSCCLTGEDELHYHPYAAKDSNKLYEGFETNGQPAVKVDIVGNDGNPVGAGSVTGDEGMVLEGHHALCLDLSKAVPVFENEYYKEYMLLMELGDIAALGVNAGDSIAFGFGGADQTDVWGQQYLTYAGEPGGEYDNVSVSYPHAWEMFEIKIPEDMDLGCCAILTDVVVSPDMDKIWIDSIGAGGERVPYTFANGTSMACPAAAGAAAVLASRYNADGSDLADIVRASVRPMPALEGIIRTGGIIDLSIDVDVAAKRGPAIDSMSYKGRTIILKGKGFGSVKGNVTMTKEVVGAEPKKLNTKIESWTDGRVCLLLNEDTKGVLKAVLTSAESGKTDTITEMISLSENIYAKDLPLDSETVEPYAFDAPGDAETSGTLQAIGEKLYYLPATTKVELMPAFRNLYAFDPNTEEWEEKAPLPLWIENISAAAVSGNLYVKGSPMDVDESGQIPTSANDPRSAIYAYDPAKDEWTECSSAEVSFLESLVGDGTSMYLVGTGTSDYGKGLVRAYDPVTGAGEPVGTLTEPMNRPSAVIQNGMLYVYDAASYHLESMKLKSGAAAEDLSDLLPDIYEDDSGFLGSAHEALHEAVLLAADKGLLIIGPPAADGSSDTWFLKSGTKKIVPGRKRVSDSRIGALAAAVYNSSVYVIGSAMLETLNRFFRTDTLDSILPQDPVSIDNSKVVLSKTAFTYNGKVQKPEILTIGGKKLMEGIDYTVKWSGSSSKNVGSYSLTVTGKGNYEGTATAAFTIVPLAIKPDIHLSKAGYVFNGKERKPTVTVRYKDKILDSSNYDVTYAKGRKKVGSYKVTVRMKGNYSGSASKTFNITKAANPIKVRTKTPTAKSAKNTTIRKANAFTISRAQGTVTFKKISGNSRITVASNGAVSVKKGLKKGSTYAVKIMATAAGNANYKSGSKTVTLKIKIK